MDGIYERCCGLDIRKKTVVARLIVPAKGRQIRKDIRTFGTIDRRPPGVSRLAGSGERDARGYGVDRSVLEAAVQFAGGPVPAAAGECARHQAGAGPHD